MLKFPKIVIDKFQNGANIHTGFDREAIVRIFNGKNSIESIYGHFLSEGIDLDKVNNLFHTLIENDLVVDKIDWESSVLSDRELEGFSRQIATLSRFSQQYDENKFNNLVVGLKSQEKLHGAEIVFFGNSPLIHEVADKCNRAGIRATPAIKSLDGTSRDADLFVYLPDKYDEDELIDTLKYCDAVRVPFFPGFQTNYGIELGPFYVPGDSACSLCLISRKKSVLGEGYNQSTGDPLHFNFPIGSDQIVLEIIKFITGIAPLTLRNKVLQFNIMSGISAYHPVLKVPNCAVCGLRPLQPKRKLWEGIV